MSTNHNVKRIIVGALLSGSVALAGLGLSMGTAQAFNPQPDPPGKPIAVGTHEALTRQLLRPEGPVIGASDGLDQPVVCTTG